MSTHEHDARIADLQTTGWRLALAGVILWPLALVTLVVGARLVFADNRDGMWMMLVAVAELALAGVVIVGAGL